MRVANWKAAEIFGQIRKEAITAITEVMDDVVISAKARCPVGEVRRDGSVKEKWLSFTPGRGRGKGQLVSFGAKQWQGREPGSLRESIRRVTKPSRPGNIRVYAGNFKVWYAHFVEYGTVHAAPHSFMRKSFHEVKNDVIQRVENEIGKNPEVKK